MELDPVSIRLLRYPVGLAWIEEATPTESPSNLGLVLEEGLYKFPSPCGFCSSHERGQIYENNRRPLPPPPTPPIVDTVVVLESVVEEPEPDPEPEEVFAVTPDVTPDEQKTRPLLPEPEPEEVVPVAPNLTPAEQQTELYVPFEGCPEGFRQDPIKIGTCRADCADWEHWDGEECVDACVGTGYIPGRLGWSAIYERCECDNEGGYARNPDTGSCELVVEPDPIPVEVDLSCTGSAPRTLTYSIGDHASNLSWWNGSSFTNEDLNSAARPDLTPPSAYPWTHTHTIVEITSPGDEHSHPVGVERWGRVCGGSSDDYCTNSRHGDEDLLHSWTRGHGHGGGSDGFNHSHDGRGDHSHTFADLGHHAPKDKHDKVFSKSHWHDRHVINRDHTHAHPLGSHGSDYCYSGEKAACGNDGTWRCQ